jgi:hypothetical protein
VKERDSGALEQQIKQMKLAQAALESTIQVMQVNIEADIKQRFKNIVIPE